MKKNILLSFVISLFLISCAKKEAYVLPELTDVVIYQINPRVFAPENSFNAVVPHLDSIKELGCNILWFMPIYEIGEVNTKNSPYCVKDYKSVNPEFGTMDEFKNLITLCHQKGMGVIVDWVPNHTAWDNPWIVNKDWYTQDSIGNIIYPADTDWTDVADLNFDNQDMRLAMIDAMKFWVNEVGVDGFRCDAVDYVPADFLKQCVDSLRAIPGKKLLMLAEGTRKDHFDSGFDLNYAWGFAHQMRQVYLKNEPASTLFAANTEEYEGIPAGKLKLRFTTNHDEAAKHAPIVEWVNTRGSMSAYATILFFPGVPMIYGSQEVGYPNDINFFKHIEMDWTTNPELWQEYQKLLSIHNAGEGLRKGELKQVIDDRNVLMFERISDKETYTIAINVRDSVVTVALPEEICNKQYINLFSGENQTLNDSLTLQPFEYLILK
ncbi:MAG: alpha-glucosidase C-terminal domain-containing protein [Dysgonamonadaceae bacterium]|jgi:glycosidase|nr:alpha-glucosidase C-terminal domain-containing protein [Dysgonamonadaceae bacterium]